VVKGKISQVSTSSVRVPAPLRSTLPISNRATSLPP